MQSRIGSVLTILVLGLALAPRAEAVPAFARKLGMGCRECHSAWPALNKFGRNFKENGYRLDPGFVVPKQLVQIGDQGQGKVLRSRVG